MRYRIKGAAVIVAKERVISSRVDQVSSKGNGLLILERLLLYD